jgi:hypothetical protein
MSALLAPDAMGSGRPGIGYPGGGGGGGWPGGPLGGIILGRRGPLGGSRGPVITGPRTHSAGTAEIARASGGDSLRVDDASALETTLTRIRQRYALHFTLPEGSRPGQERNIEVELASAAKRRHPDAEVRFRRVYLAPGGPAEPVTADSAELRRRPAAEPSAAQEGGWRSATEAGNLEAPRHAGVDRAGGGASVSPDVSRRRPAVDRSSGGAATPSVSSPEPQQQQQGGWRRSEEQPERPAGGGWRRVKPGEQP